MLTIPHLEWHVTHSCNFTCQGCGHFTNDGYRQNFTIDVLKEWYLLWSKKIRPKELSMLGGEPLLNKDIVNIIYMTKEVWNIQDDQEFELVSNGILFDKVNNLSTALKETNCILTITKHSNDETYLKLYNKSIESIQNSGVNYRVYNAPEFWVKPYEGYGHTIKPIKSDDYIESWNNCIAGQENFQLYDGKIYKCGLTAYLPLQKKKYGDKLSKEWNPYLKYVPLDPSASDLEVLEFFLRTHEPVCSMCPKTNEHFNKESPLHSPQYAKKRYGFI